jgi:tRNA modification GTPase
VAFDQLEGTLTGAIGEIEARLFDLIARLEASLDFPEEGYHFVERERATNEMTALVGSIDRLLKQAARGRLLREGAQIAVIGAPNVGKSSLFNALVNANRAIVTPIPGTTRDLLTERAEIRGMAISLVDTAGLRATSDVVEQEGIARARHAMSVADVILVVLDCSRELSDADRTILESTVAHARIVVINKIDLPAVWTDAGVSDAVRISATTSEGVETLLDRIAERLGSHEERRDQPVVTNIRHIELLRRTGASLCRAIDALSASNGQISEEFILADLQEGAGALQEITGQRTTEDLLAHIFSRFCIGK